MKCRDLSKQTVRYFPIVVADISRIEDLAEDQECLALARSVGSTETRAVSNAKAVRKVETDPIRKAARKLRAAYELSVKG